MQISIEAIAATPARCAFFSPRRLPILERVVRHVARATVMTAYRTEVAIPKAYGTWKVDETVESSTDCVANGMGPRLQGSTQWRILVVISLLTSWQQLKSFAMRILTTQYDVQRTSNEFPRPPFRCNLTCASGEYISGNNMDMRGTYPHRPC